MSTNTQPRRVKSNGGGGLVEQLERLRLARVAARASLKECARVSGLPKWRVQEILSGAIDPKPQELRLLIRTVKQLDRAFRPKRNLLSKTSA